SDGTQPGEDTAGRDGDPDATKLRPAGSCFPDFAAGNRARRRRSSGARDSTFGTARANPDSFGAPGRLSSLPRGVADPWWRTTPDARQPSRATLEYRQVGCT